MRWHYVQADDVEGNRTVHSFSLYKIQSSTIEKDAQSSHIATKLAAELTELLKGDLRIPTKHAFTGQNQKSS